MRVDGRSKENKHVVIPHMIAIPAIKNINPINKTIPIGTSPFPHPVGPKVCKRDGIRGPGLSPSNRSFGWSDRNDSLVLSVTSFILARASPTAVVALWVVRERSPSAGFGVPHTPPSSGASKCHANWFWRVILEASCAFNPPKAHLNVFN